MQAAAKQWLRNVYPIYRPFLSGLGLLDYLARVHGTDKYNHGYLEHYQAHFRHLRFRRLKLLEIGVGGPEGPERGGASLRMWKDYFPRSQIFAIDIQDKKSHEEDRVRIFQGDQNDPAFLDEMASGCGPFDIIIDDGSHISEHVITSFRALFPHLKDGGHYVIEDLQCSYQMGAREMTLDPDGVYSSIGMLKTLVDDLNYRYIPRQPQNYGDRIVAIHFYPKICFIRKGDNAQRDDYVENHEPSREAVR